MNKLLLCSVLFLVFSYSASAQQYECSEGTALKQVVFENMYAGVNSFAKKLCESMIDGNDYDEHMKLFVLDWKEKFALNLQSLDKLDFDKELVVNLSYEALLDFKQPPQLLATNVTNGSYADLQLSGKKIARLKKSDCKYYNLKNCKSLFNKINQAVLAPYDSIQKNTIARKISAHEFRNKAWTNYFTNSRSQTSLDLLVNTLYYKKELQKETYVGPPNKQYFFLHPSIIMHYSDDADKGERMKEALAIEWFGVNYWSRSTPLGWSAISTYADRSSVRSVSHGLMIHVNNSYSFGFTTNSEKEHGLFVTFDLLKLFEDSKSNYKSYINSAKKRFN